MFQMGSTGIYCCTSCSACLLSIFLITQYCMSELLSVQESMLPGLCMPRNFPIAHHSGMSLSAFHSFRMLLFQPVLVHILLKHLYHARSSEARTRKHSLLAFSINCDIFLERLAQLC